MIEPTFLKSQNLEIEAVGIAEAKAFCVRWHYSNIFPPHCIISLGYRDAKGLAGVALWGWGVRPRHTIEKLFPTLGTEDYWELNRLCLRDDCPRNFLYALPLGTTRQSKPLFASSPNQWGQNYPKHADLIWRDDSRNVVGVAPVITQSGTFRNSEPSLFDEAVPL